MIKSPTKSPSDVSSNAMMSGMLAKKHKYNYDASITESEAGGQEHHAAKALQAKIGFQKYTSRNSTLCKPTKQSNLNTSGDDLKEKGTTPLDKEGYEPLKTQGQLCKLSVS